MSIWSCFSADSTEENNMGFKKENGFHAGDFALVVHRTNAGASYQVSLLRIVSAMRDGDKISYSFFLDGAAFSVSSKQVFDDKNDAQNFADSLNRLARGKGLKSTGWNLAIEQRIREELFQNQTQHISIHYGIREVWFQDSNGGNTELRLLFLPGIKVTISRVDFPNGRFGTMTKILAFLTDFCKSNNYPILCVQAVSTPEMEAFCKKHKFAINKEAIIEIKGHQYGDYNLYLGEK